MFVRLYILFFVLSILYFESVAPFPTGAVSCNGFFSSAHTQGPQTLRTDDKVVVRLSEDRPNVGQPITVTVSSPLPFKGVLIQSNNGILSPFEINSTLKTLDCQGETMAATHINNVLKTSAKVDLLVEKELSSVLQVYMVFENTATYSHYGYTTTEISYLSSSVVLPSVCHVCTEANRVGNTFASIDYFGQSMSCRDIETSGQEGKLRYCSYYQKLAFQNCQCSPSPPCLASLRYADSDKDGALSMSEFSQALNIYSIFLCGVQNEQLQQLIRFSDYASTCQCPNSASTNNTCCSPSSRIQLANITEMSKICLVDLVGAMPTCPAAQQTSTSFLSSAYGSTLEVPCHICGSPDMVVTAPSAMVFLPGNSFQSCDVLEQRSKNKTISMDECPWARNAADLTCRCRNPTLAPTITPTLEPTPALLPVTAAPWPTLTNDYEVCTVCGDGYVMSNPEGSFGLPSVDAPITLCLDYQSLRARLPLEICRHLQSITFSACGCAIEQTTSEPTASPSVPQTDDFTKCPEHCDCSGRNETSGTGIFSCDQHCVSDSDTGTQECGALVESYSSNDKGWIWATIFQNVQVVVQGDHHADVSYCNVVPATPDLACHCEYTTDTYCPNGMPVFRLICPKREDVEICGDREAFLLQVHVALGDRTTNKSTSSGPSMTIWNAMVVAFVVALVVVAP